MKRILTTSFAWHLAMLIIGVLAAPSSALGWSILATASPFRLRVRHLIAMLAVVLLLSFVPVLLTRGTVRRILYGLPLLLLPGMLLSVFRRADGMRFTSEPMMLAVTGGILLLAEDEEGEGIGQEKSDKSHVNLGSFVENQGRKEKDEGHREDPNRHFEKLFEADETPYQGIGED